MNALAELKVIHRKDPMKYTKGEIYTSMESMKKQRPSNMPDEIYFTALSQFNLAITLYNSLGTLTSYGVDSFRDNMLENDKKWLSENTKTTQTTK